MVLHSIDNSNSGTVRRESHYNTFLWYRCPCKEMIYRWPLRQTEKEVKEEQRTFADQKVISPAQEARVNDVTHNLVQWGRDLVSTILHAHLLFKV